jgi:uncharacterized coiled-coil protein SlyX
LIWNVDVKGATAAYDELIDSINSSECIEHPGTLVAPRMISEVFQTSSREDVSDRSLTAEQLHRIINATTEELKDWCEKKKAHHIPKWFERIDDRISELEQVVTKNRDLLQKLDDRVQSLQFSSTEIVTSISPPPLDQGSITRTRLVKKVADSMVDSLLTLLTGERKSGRTNVLRDVVKHQPSNAVWLDLGDPKTPGLMPSLVEVALQLGGETELWPQVLDEAFSSARAPKLVVLDGLPKPEEQPIARLAELCHVLSKHDVNIVGSQLGTENRRLSARLDGQLSLVTNLRFSDREVEEILSKYIGEERLSERLVRAVAVATERNAFLVRAASEYLARAPEREDESLYLEELCNGDYAQTLSSEVSQALIESTQDDTQELIYRFKIPLISIDEDLAGEVADVEPDQDPKIV